MIQIKHNIGLINVHNVRVHMHGAGIKLTELIMTNVFWKQSQIVRLFLMMLTHKFVNNVI